MRTLCIASALVAIHLIGPLGVFTQISNQSAIATRSGRKIKVDVHYGKKNDISTARLEDIILWENPVFFEQIAMVVAFDYPKRTIVTPKSVSVLFFSVSKDRTLFHTDSLAAVVDSVRLDLGKLEGGSRDLTPRTGTFFGRLRSSISYQDFSRIAQAKRVSLLVADNRYDLSDQQLQSLRNFLELMRQQGQEFR